jgi:hypothetical protein
LNSADKIPASLLPIEVDRNHAPIISAVRRGGLSFDTIERPIGLRQSSPIVTTK